MNKLSKSRHQLVKPKVLFIVGTTASGKSDLAMKLARNYNGGIICADSQTLRKDLNIGTAKPSIKDRAAVPHYLIDLIDPYERFSVAAFKMGALKAINDCREKGLQPIIVGGTGLYIDALFYDYKLEATNLEERRALEKLSVNELQLIIEREGYQMPENKDNPRHLVGLLSRKGETSKDVTPIPGSIIVGIDREPEVLKRRIAKRIEVMLKDGLVDEVKSVEARYGKPPDKLDAICYPIFSKYLHGEISLDKAKELFAMADWQYARRQKAWFKRNKYIQWFGSSETAYKALHKLLANP